MACFEYVVLSRCKPGEAEEYERWYCGRHLEDVCRIKGVVSARFFRTLLQRVYNLDAPQWPYITIYQLETDDPQALIDTILTLSGTEAMPLSDALDKSGMVQVVGEPLASYP